VAASHSKSKLTWQVSASGQPSAKAMPATPSPELLETNLRQALTERESKRKSAWQLNFHYNCAMAAVEARAKASPADLPPGLTPEAGCDSIAQQEQVNLAGQCKRPALGQGHVWTHWSTDS
jgi:hypothetical protein